MYYVYRFLDEKEKIIYIGRTENLNDRLTKQHFTIRGHLSQECYKEVKKVEVAELRSRSEMKMYEIYFINKNNPKYNVIDNKQDEFQFQLPDVEWVEFTGKKEASHTEEVSKLEKKVEKLKVEVKEYKSREKVIQEESGKLFDMTLRRVQIMDYILKRAGVDYDKDDFLRLVLDVGYVNDVVVKGEEKTVQEYYNEKGWNSEDRGNLLWILKDKGVEVK